MSLEDIGEDILLNVLALCGVYTVLRVSMANKFFHHVALTKVVYWIAPPEKL
ncbi:hypothetical protein C8J57DRAFT_1512330 [Mycena rebaudengoi]|nr:hypothetical protein C8J57DRAFT_1512330 [Mycena rebaudengoi]